MRGEKIIGLVIAVALALTMGCARKAEVQKPRFNKAATRDIIEGNTWYMRGCYVKALASFHKAYEKFTAQDDQDGAALALNNLGSVYRAEKDWDSALLFFEESRRIFERTGDSRGLVQALANTAATFTDMDQLDKAETALDEAEAAAVKNSVALPTLKSNRALVLIRRGHTAEAEKLLAEAEAQSSPDKPFEYATIVHAMGLCAEKKGDPDSALRHYARALESDRKAGYSKSIADDLAAMGRVLAAMNRHTEALEALYRSLGIRTLLADVKGAEALSVQIKTSLEALGDGKPDLRVREHFLKRWSEGEKKAGICQ